jgi:anti-sigma B factor antagonist
MLINGGRAKNPCEPADNNRVSDPFESLKESIMEIKCREEGNNVLVVDVVGDLDARSAGDLKLTLNEKIENGSVWVLINLSEVPYMDSAGLGVLVSGLKNTNRQNGDLRLWGLQPDVRNIFELTRLNKVFQIFDSEETALASF